MKEIRKPLTGDAYWRLMEKTARRVERWPDWKTGERSVRHPVPTIQEAIEICEVSLMHSKVRQWCEKAMSAEPKI